MHPNNIFVLLMNYIIKWRCVKWNYSYCKQLIDITSAYDDCKPNKDQKGKETLCTWIDYSKNGYRHRRRFPSIPMNQWLQEAIQGGK